MPVLKRALQAFRSGHISNPEGMRWLWLVCHVAIIEGYSQSRINSPESTQSIGASE